MRDPVKAQRSTALGKWGQATLGHQVVLVVFTLLVRPGSARDFVPLHCPPSWVPRYVPGLWALHVPHLILSQAFPPQGPPGVSLSLPFPNDPNSRTLSPAGPLGLCAHNGMASPWSPLWPPGHWDAPECSTLIFSSASPSLAAKVICTS
jgi:hypothetical protein